MEFLTSLSKVIWPSSGSFAARLVSAVTGLETGFAALGGAGGGSGISLMGSGTGMEANCTPVVVTGAMLVWGVLSSVIWSVSTACLSTATWRDESCTSATNSRTRRYPSVTAITAATSANATPTFWTGFPMLTTNPPFAATIRVAATKKFLKASKKSPCIRIACTGKGGRSAPF